MRAGICVIHVSSPWHTPQHSPPMHSHISPRDEGSNSSQIREPPHLTRVYIVLGFAPWYLAFSYLIWVMLFIHSWWSHTKVMLSCALNNVGNCVAYMVLIVVGWAVTIENTNHEWWMCLQGGLAEGRLSAACRVKHACLALMWLFSFHWSQIFQ